MHHMDADLAHRKKKVWHQLHKNTTCYTEQILKASSHKTAAERPPNSHIKKRFKL